MQQSTGQSRRGKYHHGDLRSALLEAAEAELEERGFERFTLRGVAKRAGVSHAAPAHHFKDTAALLTALTVTAAERFHNTMTARQALAAPDPRSQFIASGLGYIDFALGSPALFRLMFGSERPDFEDEELIRHATMAFRVLVDGVGSVRKSDPMATEAGRIEVATAWAIVHGIANLLSAGRMKFLEPALQRDRESALTRMIERALP